MEGAAIARRCWPGEAVCSGAGGRGQYIWEREEAMIQSVGGCDPLSKGEGQGNISGGRWTVRHRRVRRGSVCGIGVWVCRMANHGVVLCGCDSEEVGARAEHMRWGDH